MSNYITKHLHYINHRIDVLREYASGISSISERAFISDIVTSLIGEKAFIHSDAMINESIEELKSLVDTWDIINDGDIIGYIYQMIETSGNKKKKGQFFTPQKIVSYLIESCLSGVTDPARIKILDPACGSGQFLITTYLILLQIYIQCGYSKEDAQVMIFSNNLFGCDTDSIAVKIARYNLKQISSLDSLQLNLYNIDFLDTESLFSTSPLSDKTFDIILGNPPWGSKLDSEQKKYYKKIFEATHTGVNSFSLFIEQSIKLLSKNGIIGFLIPEAFLNIKAHWESRKMILNTMCIKEISLWGEQFKNVFAPSISLIIQRSAEMNNRQQNIIKINHQTGKNDCSYQLIPQYYYYSTYQNIFNINYSQKAASIIDKINQKEDSTLFGNSKFFLGIVTGNNDEHLSLFPDEKHPDPIIVGKDIGKYRISFSGHFFSYKSSGLQQVAPEHYYTSKNKIFYRFIGKNLTFATDYDGLYSLNNVNGFLPENDLCSSEYLTALFNSSVIQYYYNNSFFTIKVLRGNLEKIPLRICSNKDQEMVSTLAKTAAFTTNMNDYRQCLDQIDDFFFHAYGINDKEAALIKGN